MPSGLPWLVKPYEGNDNLGGSFLTSRYNKCKWTGNEESDKSNGTLGFVKRFHKYIYTVAYSDHSCFSEIEEFIKLVQPINMKGIVLSSSCYVDPFYYFGRLCGVKQPVKRLHRKYEIKEGDENRHMTKATFGRVSIIKSERKRARSMKVKFLGVQASRVKAYRRVQCGAKIVENDCPD